MNVGTKITMWLLLLWADGVTMLLAEDTKSLAWQHRLFNEWEVAYSAGSPFGASEWRRNKNSEYYEKFTQMWQINFCHQFSELDYGAASAGYRYPSLGCYMQWLDYSHLAIRGTGTDYPVTQQDNYGQIATLGWTLHQYLWDRGSWRLHLNVENGATYVFRPHYQTGVSTWVTLPQHWQIFIDMGLYLDRSFGLNEVGFGTQFTHMSNSGLGAYNTGINNFSLSVRYRRKSIESVQRCRMANALLECNGEPFQSHLYGSVVTSLGGVYFEQSEHPNGQLWVAGDLMYRINPTNGLGIGLDYFHNAQPDRTGHREYLGSGIKYDRWIGPFVLHLQCGAYLNRHRPIKWKDKSPTYQVLGFKYVMYRTKKFSPYIGIYSKSTGFNAEMMSFGLGATIK